MSNVTTLASSGPLTFIITGSQCWIIVRAQYVLQKWGATDAWNEAWKMLRKKNIRKKSGLFLALVSLDSNCYPFRGHYDKYKSHEEVGLCVSFIVIQFESFYPSSWRYREKRPKKGGIQIATFHAHFKMSGLWYIHVCRFFLFSTITILNFVVYQWLQKAAKQISKR